jgi:hypothetical protein
VPRPLAVCLAGLWVAASASGVLAQDFRGWATTSVQLVELRPIGLDSVPRSDVVQDAAGRFSYDGREVSCVTTTLCTGYFALADDHTIAATQDLHLTYWGFGVQGLSATALVRARARSGGDLTWPRADDEFDAMLAYAQLQRGPVRVRAGRQDMASGLGFSGFDGASASYAGGSWRAEVYGGRSLARGLREPANEAMRGLDDFFVDESVLMVGASGSLRDFGSVVTARYQREILWDRSSLVSERGSIDFSTTSLPRVHVRGSFEYDFSFERVGKSELTVSSPFAEGRWLGELSARRYVPYFDLSTIWGYFEPVSYGEVVARVGWSPSGTLSAWLSGGWRTYMDTETEVIFTPMRDDGWRAEAGGRWQLAPAWRADGRYQLEWGPGGFLNSVEASVRFDVTGWLGASLTGLSFQQIEEYRLGEGRAFGGGASADVQVNDRIALSAGFSMIRHRDGGNAFTSPWNQARGWSSLRFAVGGDPGLADRRGRP